MDNIDLKILDTPLDADQCTLWVKEDSTGGIVSFLGSVRNFTANKKVDRLEFEAYKPMAIKEMQKICSYIIEKWDVRKISMHHRIGQLEIGELAVVIAVSAPHRKAAFAACGYAIDTLKETVPIWKKEIFQDGEVWVAAHP